MNNSTSIDNSFDDFMEHSRCGFFTISPAGIITQANHRICEWLGVDAGALRGSRLSDHLTIGGKMFFETHLFLLLRMQGFFDEVALDLIHSNGERIPMLLNGYERFDENKDPQFIRITFFRAVERRQFEQNLRTQHDQMEQDLFANRNVLRLREQLIAVLGHDLRNPLGAIISGTELLSRGDAAGQYAPITRVLRRSTQRMAELINNILDFARTRLGEGIVITLSDTNLTEMLQQVVDELHTQHPERTIEVTFDVEEPVFCDGHRISQLFSNLLANAMTHGDHNYPIQVTAYYRRPQFQLAVTNKGRAIEPTLLRNIFEPFARETARASSNGLGLGLYIASQISEAHQGSLTCTSTDEATQFLFEMHLAQQ